MHLTSYSEGASPGKQFGDRSINVLTKEVTVNPSGPREVATVAGGTLKLQIPVFICI